MKNEIQNQETLSRFYWEVATVIVLNKLLTNSTMEQLDVDMIIRDATMDGLFQGDSFLIDYDTSCYVKSDLVDVKKLKFNFSDLIMYLVANYFDHLTPLHFKNVKKFLLLPKKDICLFEILPDYKSMFLGSSNPLYKDSEIERDRAKLDYKVAALCAKLIINDRSIRFGIFEVHNILQTKESHAVKLCKIKKIINGLDFSEIFSLFENSNNIKK